MKKPLNVLAATLIAGAIFNSVIPAAQAASFPGPILAQPTENFPFVDVPVSSKDVVQYYSSAKVIQGVSKTQFGWSHSIKRIDAAFILAKVLGADFGIVTTQTTFKDLPYRAVRSVSYLQERGIVNGKTETSFGAGDTVTRGEFAIWASRAYDKYLYSAGKATHNFTDATGRYKEAISRLQASGITGGKSETQFGTNSPITRGEFIIMIHRLQSLIDLSIEPIKYEDTVLPSEGNGVLIKTEKSSYTLKEIYEKDSIRIDIENKSDTELLYSPAFVLQKKFKLNGKDNWELIGYRDEFVPPAVIESVEGNTTAAKYLTRSTLKESIYAGDYRIVQIFTDKEGNKQSTRIAAYFTVTH